MKNPFSLEGKTILVTGASSGIGRGIAIECSKMGANVVITGRNKERLNETYEALSGGNNKQIIADLSDEKQMEDLVNQCPILNGCVNNAGIPKLMTVKFIQKEDLNEIIRINTIAPILLTSLLVKKKKLIKDSSIVFVSSISTFLFTGSAVFFISALGIVSASFTTFAPQFPQNLAFGLSSSPQTLQYIQAPFRIKNILRIPM